MAATDGSSEELESRRPLPISTAGGTGVDSSGTDADADQPAESDDSQSGGGGDDDDDEEEESAPQTAQQAADAILDEEGFDRD